MLLFLTYLSLLDQSVLVSCLIVSLSSSGLVRSQLRVGSKDLGKTEN